MASVFKAANSEKYTIFYYDEHHKRRKTMGYTDKGASLQRARELERESLAKKIHREWLESRRAKRKKIVQDTIYLIRNPEVCQIKIGYTGGNAIDRMRDLQTSTAAKLELLGTIPGTIQDERKLHRIFKPFHVGCEWFQDVPEVRAILKEVAVQA